MKQEKKKLAVIFPGIGYHSDKPLLYYAKKLAREEGFSVEEVLYGKLPRDDRKEACEIAVNAARRILTEIGLDSYDTVLFLSKSIGTIAASICAAEQEKTIHHIYFTPISRSLPLLSKNGIAFHGIKDSWADTEMVKAACERLNLPLYITEGANHSMETGDVMQDLLIQAQIAKRCKEFIKQL